MLDIFRGTVIAMKMSYKKPLIYLAAGLATIAISASLLLGSAQSQQQTQCESWLQNLLTSQNGIHYILSKISDIVTGKASTQTAGGLTVIGGLTTTPNNQPAQELGLQATSIATKVTEKNDAYHKFAWVLTVSNTAESGRSFTTKIEWLDTDGFIIDDDIAYDLIIAAGEEKQFTGYALVDAEAADTITSINAEIPRRYVTTIDTTRTTQPITAKITR